MVLDVGPSSPAIFMYEDNCRYSLLAAAKEFAAQRRTTLRALVEQGLRQVLHRGPRPGEFQLRDARFQGQGLQAEFRDGGWDRIRDAAYSGRGG